MKVFLVAQIPGPMHGHKVPLTIPLFTIGRDSSCTLQADDAAIAELHCAVEIFEERVFAHDLASPGGTFVNDVRITGETQVHSGDRLKVGPLLFSVTMELDKTVAQAQRNKAVPKKPEPVDDQSAAAAANKLLKKIFRKKPERNGDGVTE